MNRFARYAEGGEAEQGAGNRFARYTANRPRQEISPLAAIGSGAADAFSFGFGDEAMGLVFGPEAETAARERQEMARATRPYSFGGGQIGGALLGGYGVGAGVRGALRAAPNLARAAGRMGPFSRIGVGAGAGGAGAFAYGAGDMRGDAGDRIARGLHDAPLGALLGGGVQGAGELLAPAARHLLRSFNPEARAAYKIGQLQERYGQDPAALRQALASAPDNAIVADVVPGGSSLVMGAGARPSRERDALRAFYDERNNAMGARAGAAIDRHLLDGNAEETGAALRRLEDVQRTQAAPLYAQVHAGRVETVPRPLQDFLAFHGRPGAAFYNALQTTRETMRRTLGVDATDAQMAASPVFWHRLLENVEADVGASFRAARINPLGAPRGSAVADMTQDARGLNTQVRRLLGPTFRQAQDVYAGAARNQQAIETGADAVSGRLDSLALARLQRQMGRMSAGERMAFKLGAANKLKDLLANADTGSGRADVLRSIMRNAGQRRLLSEVFKGDDGFEALMRELDTQRDLFNNSIEAGIGVNSHTADKLLASGTVQAANPFSPGSWSEALLRPLFEGGRDAFDEALSNHILSTLRVPASQALREMDAAGGLQQWARGRGLLSAAARHAQEGRRARPRRLSDAASLGLYTPIGGETLAGYGGL